MAPSIDDSRSGELTAVRAASAARFSPCADADAHQGRAGVAHDRADVGEVEVDDAGHGDQVGDALHALAKDVVGHLERVRERSLLLDHLEQAVVLDHDQRVDLLGELGDALLGLLPAAAALEAERPRHDADRQSLELARELRDDGCAARAGAAALAGGDEDHVGALERLLQLVAALHRGGVADARVGACAETARRLRADVDLHVGVAHEKRLRVRVHRDELDAGQARVDHAVDRVRPAAADTDDLDYRQVVPGTISHVFIRSQVGSTSSLTAGFVLLTPLHFAAYGLISCLSMPNREVSINLNLNLYLRLETVRCRGPGARGR